MHSKQPYFLKFVSIIYILLLFSGCYQPAPKKANSIGLIGSDEKPPISHNYAQKIIFTVAKQDDYLNLYLAGLNHQDEAKSLTNEELYQGDASTPSVFKRATGHEIIFVASRKHNDGNGESYDSEICLLQPQAPEKLIQLTQNEATDVNPLWAPNGQWIAYISNEEKENYALWLMKPDGTEKRLLVDLDLVEHNNCYLSWSPNSQQIALVSDDAGQVLQIVDINQGRIIKKYQSAEGQFASTPSWSPDGSQIAIQMKTDLYLLPINTDAPPAKLALNREGTFSNPVWAPRGKKIAFINSQASGDHICLVDLDFQNEIKTLASSKPDFYAHTIPAWSADGQLLAFMENDPSGFSKIWVLNPEGKVIKTITGKDQWVEISGRICFVE